MGKMFGNREIAVLCSIGIFILVSIAWLVNDFSRQRLCESVGGYYINETCWALAEPINLDSLRGEKNPR